MTPPHTIAVSGFWYSGSSAVHDFLRDHAACIPLAADGISPFDGDFEPRLIRGDWERGLGQVLQYLRRGAIPPDMPALITFFRDSVLGSGRGDFDQVMNSSLRERLGPEFTVAFETLLDALEALDRATPPAQFHATCQSVFRRIFRAIPGWHAGASVLVNNDPASMSGSVQSALDAYPDCRVIAVLRDPRDMYAEVTRFVGGDYTADPQGLDNWVSRILRALERFARLAAHPDILTTSFESFIRSPAERERVRRFAGIPEGLRAGRLFDPARSAGNVGVHSDLPPSFLARIEAEVTPVVNTLLAHAGLDDPAAAARHRTEALSQLARDLRVRLSMPQAEHFAFGDAPPFARLEFETGKAGSALLDAGWTPDMQVHDRGRIRIPARMGWARGRGFKIEGTLSLPESANPTLGQPLALSVSVNGQPCTLKTAPEHAGRRNGYVYFWFDHGLPADQNDDAVIEIALPEGEETGHFRISTLSPTQRPG